MFQVTAEWGSLRPAQERLLLREETEWYVQVWNPLFQRPRLGENWDLDGTSRGI
jgi:hypothetical protein